MEIVLSDVFSDQALAVWQALGTLLGTLLLAAALLWASKQAVAQARDVWRAVRGYTPGVIGALDEPTDPLIGQLARLSHVPASVWAAFLPAFFGALAEGLDRALGDGSPPPEQAG
jgi:hypothetical protein